MRKFFCIALYALLFLCVGCAEKKTQSVNAVPEKSPAMIKLEKVLAVYDRPPAVAIRTQPDLFLSFLDSLTLDPDLLILVDKSHFLDSTYVPNDLVPITKGRTYIPGRDGLNLRKETEQALEQLASAAKRDGINIVVSSTYRSYAYQERIYNRNVKQMGKEAADRESAIPGCSQHQLGTAIDFGSITDEYAQTKPGKWLTAYAADYGFSLSFPQGMESVTGYRWECWHYRYIGTDAIKLQSAWFENIQQYMIEFLHLWYSMN